MTTLADELELLKEKKEELEKRIQDEKEQKRLEQIGQLSNLKKLIDINNTYIKTSVHKKLNLDIRTKRMIIFSTKRQFETLYEIIKKQDERIKELEKNMG